MKVMCDISSLQSSSSVSFSRWLDRQYCLVNERTPATKSSVFLVLSQIRVTVIQFIQIILIDDVRKEGKEAYSSLCYKHHTAIRELTCHMGSHSVTCHPAELTFPPLPQPIKAGTRFSDPRGMQGCVDLVGLVTYRGGIPAEDGHPSQH